VDHYETYYTYTDNGNGTFTEVPHERAVYTTEYYTEYEDQPVYQDVPRYATKYYYNIRRWVTVRTESASGQDHSPVWPELTLGENEREGRRGESYRFFVRNTKNDRDTAVYRLAEDVWMNLNVGDPVCITSRRSGADPYLSDAKGNRIADLIQEGAR
jgi:hypothetical protein